MNRRTVLEIAGTIAGVTVSQLVSARGENAARADESAGAPEIATAAELQRVHDLGPFNTRYEFKIVTWLYSRDGDLTKIFNKLAVAGWSFRNCTFCDGLSGQYIFTRLVPREATV